MSNRAQRRSDTREFRHRDHVLTHLIDVRADLSGFPMLERIAAAWSAAIPSRKPFCFCCRSKFSDSARPGAYLFATSPGAADIASVSVMCVECWQTLPMTDIERIAARVLRAIIPDGRFDPGTHHEPAGRLCGVAGWG